MEYSQALAGTAPADGADLLRHRIATGRATTDKIADWMHAFSRVQDRYAAELEQMLRKAPLPEADLGTFAQAWQSNAGVAVEIARLSSMLGRRVRDEIESPLREFAAREWPRADSALAAVQQNPRQLDSAAVDTVQKTDLSRLAAVKDALTRFQTLLADSAQGTEKAGERAVQELLTFEPSVEIESYVAQIVAGAAPAAHSGSQRGPRSASAATAPGGAGSGSRQASAATTRTSRRHASSQSLRDDGDRRGSSLRAKVGSIFGRRKHKNNNLDLGRTPSPTSAYSSESNLPRPDLRHLDTGSTTSLGSAPRSPRRGAGPGTASAAGAAGAGAGAGVAGAGASTGGSGSAGSAVPGSPAGHANGNSQPAGSGVPGSGAAPTNSHPILAPIAVDNNRYKPSTTSPLASPPTDASSPFESHFKDSPSFVPASQSPARATFGANDGPNANSGAGVPPPPPPQRQHHDEPDLSNVSVPGPQQVNRRRTRDVQSSLFTGVQPAQRESMLPGQHPIEPLHPSQPAQGGFGNQSGSAQSPFEQGQFGQAPPGQGQFGQAPTGQAGQGESQRQSQSHGQAQFGGHSTPPHEVPPVAQTPQRSTEEEQFYTPAQQFNPTFESSRGPSGGFPQPVFQPVAEESPDASLASLRSTEAHPHTNGDPNASVDSLGRAPSFARQGSLRRSSLQRAFTGDASSSHPPLPSDQGLVTTIKETLTARIQDGQLTQAAVTGEINAAVHGPPVKETVRLVGGEQAQTVAPNSAVLRAVSGSGDIFEIDSTQFSSQPITLVKYTGEWPAIVPVVFTPVWRVEDTQSRLMLTYELPESYPSDSVVLLNLTVAVMIQGGRANSAQSKPIATFSKEKQRVTWRFTQPVELRRGQPQRLLCQFATSGRATEAPNGIEARFSSTTTPPALHLDQDHGGQWVPVPANASLSVARFTTSSVS